MPPLPSVPPLVVWALAAKHAGMRAQADGLAMRLAQLAGHGAAAFAATVHLPAAIKPLPPNMARYFARVSALAAQQPFSGCADISDSAAPHIVLGCGAAGGAAALAAAKRHGAFAVYVQRPAAGARHFQAIVAPRHDYARRAMPPNVLPTLGAVGRIAPQALQQQRAAARRRFGAGRLLAALIGGDNRAYAPCPRQLAQQLANAARASGARLLITPSRRTPAPITRALHQRFGQPDSPHFVWDGRGDNPYTDILAAADAFCVTADSVNMISEASAAGRAVYILPLPRKSGWRAARAQRKFSHFHRAIIARGGARFFPPAPDAVPAAASAAAAPLRFFAAEPLDETDRIARLLLARWHNWRQPAAAP